MSPKVSRLAVAAVVVCFGLESKSEPANFIAEALPAFAVGEGSCLFANIGQMAAFGAQQEPSGDSATHGIVTANAD